MADEVRVAEMPELAVEFALLLQENQELSGRVEEHNHLIAELHLLASQRWHEPGTSGFELFLVTRFGFSRI